MFLNFNIVSFKSHFLIEQSSIVTMLAITVVFFLILLILGIRKSYKLKKENDRLNALNTSFEDDDNKPYTDFTEGHLYQNNNSSTSKE
ncbi:hypothetical protein C1T31_09375 [Hanstruepera neustonica]|uniref:Uncharacterized protein n=1 Tax=Hanstruepera neustonica TaxID=1445657 RepID=A0A2K1DY11_9FLAO|nr:hypothetical protein C1T31_09375 [Hanstruepera neustonica]